MSPQKDQEDENIFLKFLTLMAVAIDAMQGERGPKGEPGVTGPKGEDGKDSIVAGPQGLPGLDGKDGVDGKDGKDGKAGAKGPKGDTGPAGKDGKDGIDGKDGNTISPDLVIDITTPIIVQNVQKAVSSKTYSVSELEGMSTATSGQVPTKQADGSWSPATPSGGSTPVTITVTQASYSVTETSGFINIFCDATANAITINLPTAVGNTATYRIKKTDSSANTVTIDGLGGELIDGDATQIIQFQNTAVQIISNDTAWNIV